MTAGAQTASLHEALADLGEVARRVREAEHALTAALAERARVARSVWPTLHHLGPKAIANLMGNVISGPHLRQLTRDVHPRPRRGPAPRGGEIPSAADRVALDELARACTAVVEASTCHARAIEERHATLRGHWPVLQPLGAARVARELGPDLIGEATIRSSTADLQRRGRL